MSTIENSADETPIAKAVRLAGGVHACSRLMGVAPSTVCHRVKAGHMPMPDAIKLELKTGVAVEEMIPTDLFGQWFAYRVQKLAETAKAA